MLPQQIQYRMILKPYLTLDSAIHPSHKFKLCFSDQTLPFKFCHWPAVSIQALILQPDTAVQTLHSHQHMMLSPVSNGVVSGVTPNQNHPRQHYCWWPLTHLCLLSRWLLSNSQEFHTIQNLYTNETYMRKYIKSFTFPTNTTKTIKYAFLSDMFGYLSS